MSFFLYDHQLYVSSSLAWWSLFFLTICTTYMFVRLVRGDLGRQTDACKQFISFVRNTLRLASIRSVNRSISTLSSTIPTLNGSPILTHPIWCSHALDLLPCFSLPVLPILHYFFLLFSLSSFHRILLPNKFMRVSLSQIACFVSCSSFEPTTGLSVFSSWYNQPPTC